MLSTIGSIFVLAAATVGATNRGEPVVESVFLSPRITNSAIHPQPASPLEKQLWRDAQDDELGEFTLFQASLIASGVGAQEDMTRYTRLFNARFNTIERTLATRSADELPALSYRAFRTLFTTGKYDLQCSSPAQTLRTGDYNCVSATVLYLEMARRLKLPAVACAVPSHVKARLKGREIINVETTSTRWLGKGEAPLNSGRCREISDVQLLGKIYYNRASKAIDRRDFAAATGLLQIACRWDSADSAARDNRSAAMNNWAIQLSQKGQTEQATKVLTYGSRLDPSYHLFEVNLRRLGRIGS